MTALTTLMRLIKSTGPIDTFYISYKGAAYTKLKIIEIEKRPRAQDIKHKVPAPREILTNVIVVEADIDEGYKPEAARVAKRLGKIQSPCIGKPSENHATQFLIRIAMRAEYRRKYRKLFDKFIKDTREKWRLTRMALPDPKAPDTLGWRLWRWDPKIKRLISPSQQTIWHAPELRVEEWSFAKAVRGYAGIHAARMPYDWRQASLTSTELNGYISMPELTVRGVVERFERYVLGTEGWRAEWVVIKALKAHSNETGLAIEQAYPDVKVYYD